MILAKNHYFWPPDVIILIKMVLNDEILLFLENVRIRCKYTQFQKIRALERLKFFIRPFENMCKDQKVFKNNSIFIIIVFVTIFKKPHLNP